MNSAFRAQLVIAEQRQLYDYWLDKCGARTMPDRRDISPAHFPRLLPYISLIEIDRASGRYRVRLAGTRLRDIFDKEITGLYLEDLDLGASEDYWQAAYARIVEDGKPAQGVIRGPCVQQEHLVQFWLRLPLSAGGSGAGMILSYDAFLPASDMAADTGMRAESYQPIYAIG